MRARRSTIKKLAGATLVMVCAFVYLSNASFLADPIGSGPLLLAHRGLAQGFDREGLTGKTCTAARMLPSEHDHLENTISSMKAAFEYGLLIIDKRHPKSLSGSRKAAARPNGRESCAIHD